MILRRAVIAVLFLLPSTVFADVTGTWNGTLSGQENCNGGSTVAVSYTVELDLVQSGGLVTGVLQATGLDPCTPGSPSVTLVSPLNGSVSGPTFSGTSLNGKGDKIESFTATVNGTSMSFTLHNVSGTLTQTSMQAPASGLTGTYTGTYTDTIVPCGNPPGITNTGTVTVDLLQFGTSLTGSITISDSYRDICNTPGSRTVVDDGPGSALLVGQISGSTITGYLNDGKKNISLTATLSGNTISGSVAGQYPGEGATFTATRTSTGTPAPVIASFAANPSTIASGASATLSWSVINSASVSIDNGVGSQPPSGTVNVSPGLTTTYTLTATGIGGSSTATATVTVTAGAPQIVIGALPSGMLEATGGAGAIDSFTVSNSGSAAGSVTLTQSGNFFTTSPSSFTLNPGSSQIVTITASAQLAGTYDGSVAVASGGVSVPVHLLVAAPPAAPVNPQPTASRADVAAPAGQNPSGSVSFTNSGAGTVTGIAIADVPWIVPQTGAITIAPGATQSVSFNIDRSKRPDSASPNGGVAGKISLVYLTNAASKGVVALGTTPTSSVSVAVVDVVKPGVAPGTPAPLQSGEVALFVDGLRTANGLNGDLTISSLPSISSISDLQIFFTAGANPTQVSAIPAFAASSGVFFPAISKNVFGVTGTGGGSLQLRSTQTSSIALAAIDALNVSMPSISCATALPLLRSDRGIGAGDRLVFAGAQDSLTTLWIQEVSGNSGHVSIQYLDANGNVVGSDGSSIAAFTAATSAAVGGTRAIVMTNDGTGPARFAGYAVINDPTTNAGWVLTDPTHQWGSASGALIMPMISTGGVPTDLYVVNPSSSPASVSVQIESAGRRRAVFAGGGQSQPAMLAPMSTMHTTLASGNGFVRISSAAPVSAIGRITLSAGGANFGSSVPALPQSASLTAGQAKRITAVDDSSARTVAAAVPATYRSTLMLIETSGQSATVRVTLNYNFVAGGAVGSQGISSRDFNLAPNGMLTIANLAQAIIGDQRSILGDLHNMQVDVSVTSGPGTVLPFLESIDNASGDIMVRAE